MLTAMDGNSGLRELSRGARASEVSGELTRRGAPPDARVHVVVEVLPENAGLPAMARIAVAGGFGWLTEEPDLYTDTDLAPPRAG